MKELIIQAIWCIVVIGIASIPGIITERKRSRDMFGISTRLNAIYLLLKSEIDKDTEKSLEKTFNEWYTQQH